MVIIFYQNKKIAILNGNFLILVGFCVQLEMSLRVIANRAYLGGLGANMDMAAVIALPNNFPFSFEYFSCFNIIQQS